MVFSSLTFICVFLPITFALACLCKKTSICNIALCLASLVFYAYGEPVYVLLMLVSTVCNYFLGRIIDKLGKVGKAGAKAADGARVPPSPSPSPSQDFVHPLGQKVALAFAIVLNLAFLGVFKYADLAVNTANALFGAGVAVPGIALPIGISFYTFQAMSYVIDVYRADMPAQRSFVKMLLYISFFPQLIAGPIVKYHDIAAQLDSRRITLDGAALGLRRFCAGLAKKVLVADTFGKVADTIFAASATQIDMPVAWVGAIAFALQIYFDFSGYSDMAIGLARAFGFTYRENFNYPYCACSVQDFWRRWHISLSTWFKQYLYIPLGGNRRGRVRAGLNKIIVFVLCGLWHGAAWTFVVWGLVHGAFLLLEQFVPIRRLPRPLGWLYTMLVAVCAFVIFRADTFDQALLFLGQMFTGFGDNPAAHALLMSLLTPLVIATFAVAIVAMFPVRPALAKMFKTGEGKENVAHAATYILAFCGLVLSLMCIAGGGYNAFIYFRF